MKDKIIIGLIALSASVTVWFFFFCPKDQTAMKDFLPAVEGALDSENENELVPVLVEETVVDDVVADESEDNSYVVAVPEALPDFFKLEVPYTNEAPDDIWTGPWKNGCEEASIAMVEKFYAGQKTMTKDEAKEFMQMLFDEQDKLYGSNADSDALRTTELINKFSSYGAVIKESPSVEDIKKEIHAGRPVITPLYGFGLSNPNIPFLATGSSYHMIVVVGYDDVAKEFIVNDTGDRKQGKDYRYSYEVLMDNLRDFDFKTKKANGPARAIFTFSTKTEQQALN